MHIVPFCLVAGSSEDIVFEDFSGLAYQVHVFTQSDDYSGRSLTNPTVLIEFKLETKKNIRVGKHSIVGAGSMIMIGTNLTVGTSASAMSLVRKPTELRGIYVGNPAKHIKDRKQKMLVLEQKSLIRAANE